MADSSARAEGDGEPARLAALRRYAILDTAAEAAYDDVTHLAAQLCATPMALVSLVDESRQWFKSRLGLDVAETPRDIAFCSWAIQGDDLFEVADAAHDTRFRDNPLVTGDPNIRFYAGAPLCTRDGHRLGTLCVLDRVPRVLAQEQRTALRVLARQVMLQFEMRRTLGELAGTRAELMAETGRLADSEAVQRQAQRFMRGTIDALHDHIAIVDRDGVIVHVNRAWTEFAQAHAALPTLASCLAGANYLAECDRAAQVGAPQAREVAAAVRAALSGEAVAVFALEYPCHAPDEQRWFEVSVTRFDDGDQAFAVLSHRNVTERKRADAKVASLNATLEARVHERTHALEAANAALRSSEERFRSVFENTSVGAIVVERDGRIVQVNREFAAITGREVGTLMDSRYSDIVHPDDLAQLLALRQQLLDGQIPGYVQEARIVRPGGAIAWVHISVGAVRNSAGRVAQTVALVHDVSGHKRAVYERDQFFELSADMFVIVDLGGVIHRTNASFERILGFGADELNRMHYLDLVHVDDRDPMRLELARLSAGLPADLVDVRMRDKAGRYHDVRWSAAVWNERGLVLAVGRDITTRREAERALRAREAMLARAEQMALMGSFHVDPGQGAVQCSPGLLQLAGLAPQDAPDQLDAVIRLFEPQDQPALRAAIAGAESHGTQQELSLRLARGDGPPREWQIYIEPGNAPQGPGGGGVAVACLDVSAFRRATRQAQQSEQRLRALADRLQGIREEERTRISREIHDELGQLLTALKIDITMLARDLGGAGPALDKPRLLEDMRSMGRMVDSTLLSVRRIARQLRPEVLDALGLVPAIEWQASDVQARTGLQCTVEAPQTWSDIAPRLGTALFRIVQEALTNVVRHAGASRVRIRLHRTPCELLMTVQDDGVGFDADNDEAVTSLGILGMRERAISSGASFGIDSRPGEGTCITVRVPVHQAPDAVEPQP